MYLMAADYKSSCLKWSGIVLCIASGDWYLSLVTSISELLTEVADTFDQSRSVGYNDTFSPIAQTMDRNKEAVLLGVMPFIFRILPRHPGEIVLLELDWP